MTPGLWEVNMEKKYKIKYVIVYFGIALFCIIFAKIYNHFGHGVTSLYMDYMFVYPLAGFLICSLHLPSKIKFNPISLNAYGAGVAALTCGSLLKGIFRIAGTSSKYEICFYIVGIAFTIAGIVFDVISQFSKKIMI